MKQGKAPVRGSGIPREEIKRLQGLGCLRDKRYKDIFNVRVVTRNGFVSGREQVVISQAAGQFGSGELRLTPQLGIEIQGVAYGQLQDLLDYLDGQGLVTGGTGLGIHPVHSCKGTACRHGLYDTFAFTEKLHQRFFLAYRAVSLPHKFKLVVSGCPNNCVKASLADLGIIGQRIPLPDLSGCRACKSCRVESFCPAGAARLREGRIHLDPAACRNCGKCSGACPFGLFDHWQDGFKIYVGGRSDKCVAHGRPLSRIFLSEDELMAAIERAITLYKEEGLPKERFAQTIDRLGFDYVNDRLTAGAG